jgi:hemerythrin-like domain-containing protein
MASQSIREELLEDHARLERQLDALANAAEGASRDELVRVYNAFEQDLRGHMEVEEESLFPLVSDALRAGLRAEHDGIRAQLDELGLAVELHAVRKPQIDTLIARLKAHAAEENEALYAVAEEAVASTPSRFETLLAWLGRGSG